MTEPKKEKTLSKEVRANLIVTAVIVPLVLALFVATTLAVISIGIWAPVAWIWFALFTLRYLLVQAARVAVMVLTNSIKTGKKEDLGDKLSQLAKLYS